MNITQRSERQPRRAMISVTVRLPPDLVERIEAARTVDTPSSGTRIKMTFQDTVTALIEAGLGTVELAPCGCGVDGAHCGCAGRRYCNCDQSVCPCSECDV